MIKEKENKQEKIEVKIVHSKLRIYINGKIHLSIDIDKIIAFQSYFIGLESFNIDYYTTDNVMIDTQYTKKYIWDEILKGLDKITLI